MTVEYNYGFCERFVQKARGMLSTQEFTDLWCALVKISFGHIETEAYQKVHCSAAVHECTKEFMKTSSWNKQGILHQFIPRINEIASVVARQATIKARREEPLDE